MFNKLKNIFSDKLSHKCNEFELELLTKSVMDQINNQELIQFVNEKNERVLVNIQDVLYIHEKSRGEYSFVTTMNEYSVLNNNISIIINENFIQLDKRVLVNITSVKYYDSYMGLVFFEEDVDNPKVKKLQVAIKATDIVKKYLGKEKDTAKENESVYAPLKAKKRLFH